MAGRMGKLRGGGVKESNKDTQPTQDRHGGPGCVHIEAAVQYLLGKNTQHQSPWTY